MKSEKKYYGYVYLTTNLINSKKYIGQHRGEPNDSYFGSGIYIKQAIKKYGKENFKKEILCYADSQEELNKLEIEFIALHNAVEDETYYNVAFGGYTPVAVGGMKGKKHSEETKQKLRELNTGENNPNFGKYGELNPCYGRPRSEETKKKISETRIKLGVAKGENNPMYGVRLTGEKNPNYGIPLSEEQKQKISKTRKERGVAKGENNPMYGISPQERMDEKTFERWRLNLSKKVLCVTTGEVFASKTLASQHFGIKPRWISDSIRGVKKTPIICPKTGVELIFTYISTEEYEKYLNNKFE